MQIIAEIIRRFLLNVEVDVFRWCRMVLGTDFCILYVVPFLCVPVGQQEKGVESIWNMPCFVMADLILFLDSRMGRISQLARQHTCQLSIFYRGGVFYTCIGLIYKNL